MNILENIDGTRFLVDPGIAMTSLRVNSCNTGIQSRIPISLGPSIRYIILMYDINNAEIQALYPDYTTRKTQLRCYGWVHDYQK